MRKKDLYQIIVTFIICCCIIGFGVAGTHSPWDGTAWDTASPDIDQPIGNHYKELYDLRKGVALRMNKEHITLATSSAGGEHKNGAAVAYEGTSAPTNRPDASTALADNAYDRGRLWLDDNYNPPVVKRWDGSAWEVLGRMLVDAASMELTLSNEVQENTDGGRESRITFRGEKTDGTAHDLAEIRAQHDATGDDYKGDLILYTNDGSDSDDALTERVRIDSAGLVTVAGAATVGSTLGVTGDVAVNTNKFTVTAASGNTLVAGTLDVTGNIDPTTFETTNGGFKDEDNMSSNSATAVPSQQSVKAYVDTQDDAHRLQVSGSTVFNTTITSADTFQDLDLSGSVGSNYALCFFKVTLGAGAGYTYAMTPKGYASTYSTYFDDGVAMGATTMGGEAGEANVAHMICMTDGAGVVQHAASSTSPTITVVLIGYMAQN